jgi:hypothetical protein
MQDVEGEGSPNQKVFSMAALQAYLLTHVDAPLEAVNGVKEWAETYTEDHIARKVVAAAAPTPTPVPKKSKSNSVKASSAPESSKLPAVYLRRVSRWSRVLPGV